MRRACAWLALTALAGGCVTTGAPPPAAQSLRAPQLNLRLSPASLGKTFALHQHLRVEAHGEMHELEALLEVDERELRLALLVLGRPMARLTWDGSELREQRALGFPQPVSGERILSDLMFVHWPPEVIAAALPEGWELRVQDGVRELSWQAQLVESLHAEGPSVLVLDNWLDDYHMRIDSVALQD